MLTLPTYVLIAPARNAAKFIELTIKSVVAQTDRPAKWIIVSDGWTYGADLYRGPVDRFSLTLNAT
jgi:glycosyltransferase involved in cell wall biosynthesis